MAKNQPKKARNAFKRRGAPDLPHATREAQEHARQLAETLGKESQRGAALLAAAAIDDALELLLRRAMFPLKDDDPRADTVNELFGLVGEFGPLQSFGVKIQLAYAAGIIGPNMKAVLLEIKAVRNLFAHQAGVTFDDPRWADEFAEEFLPPLLALVRSGTLAQLRDAHMGYLADAGRNWNELRPSERSQLIRQRKEALVGFPDALAQQAVAEAAREFSEKFSALGPKGQYLQTFEWVYNALLIKLWDAANWDDGMRLFEGTLWDCRFGSLPGEFPSP